jgi:hypothetical protein
VDTVENFFYDVSVLLNPVSMSELPVGIAAVGIKTGPPLAASTGLVNRTGQNKIDVSMRFQTARVNARRRNKSSTLIASSSYTTLVGKFRRYILL